MKVGIIGAGQLGQMLGFAARNLDIECEFLDPSNDPPAAQAGPVLQYDFDSEAGLAQLAAGCDVITYEFENVPVAAVEKLAATTKVFPPPDALRHAQDRLAEKKLFASLDIPLPGYHAVDSGKDGDDAAARLGYPLVLKTRRLGYDGKGQIVVRDSDALHAAITQLGSNNLIAEQWVSFDCEVSAIGARDEYGSVIVYPLTRNDHDNGILSASRAPFIDDALTSQATTYLEKLLDQLDYVGVLALELFVTGDGLLANEFAPRVHNSGHWTIEGAETSQFENHMRAVAGLGLGSTAVRGFAGMLNIIGEMPSNRDSVQRAGAFLHDYGKAPRPGRKLGHITVVDQRAEDRDAVLEQLNKLLIER